MTLEKKVTGELPPPTRLTLVARVVNSFLKNPGPPFRERNVWRAKQTQKLVAADPADHSGLVPCSPGRERWLQGARRDRVR
jgi:hypothetical protein